MNSLGKFILTAGLTLWTVATTNNKAISAQIKEVFETVAPDKKILKEDTVTMPDGNYLVSEEKKSDVSWYWGKFHGRKQLHIKLYLSEQKFCLLMSKVKIVLW